MQFSVAGEAWSGRLKVVGVLGNLLTSQQIRTQRLDQNQGGFYNHLPPHPDFVFANQTDNRRFYSFLNHHQLEIRQMSM